MRWKSFFLLSLLALGSLTVAQDDKNSEEPVITASDATPAVVSTEVPSENESSPPFEVEKQVNSPKDTLPAEQSFTTEATTPAPKNYTGTYMIVAPLVARPNLPYAVSVNILKSTETDHIVRVEIRNSQNETIGARVVNNEFHKLLQLRTCHRTVWPVVKITKSMFGPKTLHRV
ncbi:A2M-N-2 domain-containing protein [Aphelenchoides bicaudatus]|nr:A2M-N-2 domain-containing protein [Aphelenchoides bicaudatus]